MAFDRCLIKDYLLTYTLIVSEPRKSNISQTNQNADLKYNYKHKVFWISNKNTQARTWNSLPSEVQNTCNVHLCIWQWKTTPTPSKKNLSNVPL